MPRRSIGNGPVGRPRGTKNAPNSNAGGRRARAGRPQRHPVAPVQDRNSFFANHRQAREEERKENEYCDEVDGN